jgi:hypothetical protein
MLGNFTSPQRIKSHRLFLIILFQCWMIVAALLQQNSIKKLRLLSAWLLLMKLILPVRLYCSFILSKFTPASWMGIVRFATNAYVAINLTSSTQSLINTINSFYHIGGDTCIGCGLEIANQGLAQNGRIGVPNVMILLTDGINNIQQSSYQYVLNTYVLFPKSLLQLIIS